MGLLGARELKVSKFKKFLKDIGADSNIYVTKKNERCTRYKGKLIFFSLVHGDKYIKEPYVNEVIVQKLHLDGLNENNPEFPIQLETLKKLARSVIHY